MSAMVVFCGVVCPGANVLYSKFGTDRLMCGGRASVVRDASASRIRASCVDWLQTTIAEVEIHRDLGAHTRRRLQYLPDGFAMPARCPRPSTFYTLHSPPICLYPFAKCRNVSMQINSIRRTAVNIRISKMYEI